MIVQGQHDDIYLKKRKTKVGRRIEGSSRSPEPMLTRNFSRPQKGANVWRSISPIDRGFCSVSLVLFRARYSPAFSWPPSLPSPPPPHPPPPPPPNPSSSSSSSFLIEVEPQFWVKKVPKGFFVAAPEGPLPFLCLTEVGISNFLLRTVSTARAKATIPEWVILSNIMVLVRGCFV